MSRFLYNSSIVVGIGLLFTTYAHANAEIIPQAEEIVSHPETNPAVTCYLGEYRAKITPERIRTFTTPAQGTVANWITDQTEAKTGEIIATVNKKDIELEEIELNLKIRKEQIAKEEELEKLDKQLKELDFYSKLSKEEKQWAANKQDQDLEARESIIKKREIIKDDLATFEEKLRHDFQKKKETYILTMPFDGIVQYQFTLPKKGEEELYIESGSVIAIICDTSNYYITISIANPQMTGLPPESLSLELPLNNGKSIKGTYSHKRVEKSTSTGGDMLAYFFKIDPEHHERAHNMIGSNLVAKLFFETSGDIKIFDKIDLARSPKAQLFSSWKDLLQQLHPDYELLVVGDTQIIARKK